MKRRIAGALATAFLAAPVLVGLVYALLAGSGRAGPGAGTVTGGDGHFSTVLSDPAVWEGTLWTLWVAAASTTLALLGAALVAVAFRGTGWTSRLGRGLAAAVRAAMVRGDVDTDGGRAWAVLGNVSVRACLGRGYRGVFRR